MNNKILMIVLAVILSSAVTFFITRELVGDHADEEHGHEMKADSHDDHDEHGEEGDHDEHGEGEESEFLRIDQDVMDEFGIEVATASPGILKKHIDLPGEVLIDPDRLAHVIPRFPGLVREVRKSLGDNVKKGEVMAIIESNESLTEYEVKSMIDGTVIEMHLTQGEMINDAEHGFQVADLSKVWVNLDIYQKDLPYIRLGQEVSISYDPGQPELKGRISYINPVMDEHTRTATARIILDNRDGILKPGMFVTGKVVTEEIPISVLLPKTAVILVDGVESVFVVGDEGIYPVPVKTGKTSRDSLEVISGILPRMKYVSKGGFILKAERMKHAFGEGHAH